MSGRFEISALDKDKLKDFTIYHLFVENFKIKTAIFRDIELMDDSGPVDLPDIEVGNTYSFFCKWNNCELHGFEILGLGFFKNISKSQLS